MSADAWAVCPRCTARNDFGYKGNEFREAWEIGLVPDEVPPRIIVSYRGECQRCDLLVEFEEYREIPDWNLGAPVELPAAEPNKPTGFVVSKPWNQIPVGWFVRAPKNVWYEVASNGFENGRQRVGLWLSPDDVLVWPRDPDERVFCRRGSLASHAQADAMDALGEGATILEDGAE
jgi:hypothetical protein